MSKCIPVKLKSGMTVMANVAPGVKQLPQSDIDALEQFVDYVVAKKRRRATAPKPRKEGKDE